MDEITKGIIYGIGAVALIYGFLKALPAVLLSDWAELRMRRHALRARAHLEALMAARQAFGQVLDRAASEDKQTVVEAV